MSAPINIAGQRFGRWEAISYTRGARWLCRCDCGVEREVDGASLRKGASRGCMQCHLARGTRRTHGDSKSSRIYRIWLGMRRRCNNPADPAFPRYGGRGITVCAEWDGSFVTFRAWAQSSGYHDRLTIDRIDNSRGYEPMNCRWATYAEQNRNYSRNRPIVYQGRTILVCDVALAVGLPQDIIKNRIFRYGWSVEDAVNTPIQKRGAARPQPHPRPSR